MSSFVVVGRWRAAGVCDDVGMAPAEPSLTRYDVDRNVRGVVLMLHGGQQSSTAPVLGRHASWWRLALMARRLSRSARERDVCVWLLRYRVRGWNGRPGQTPDPVADARWAMAQVRRTYPGVPVVLLGHSMGGRTACAAADEAGVVGVVALAPWLPPGEPVTAIGDYTPLLVTHGTGDRWTSAAASRQFVERVRAGGGAAAWFAVRGGGHFMFTRVAAWNTFVRQAALGLLLVENLPAELSDGLGQTSPT